MPERAVSGSAGECAAAAAGAGERRPARVSGGGMRGRARAEAGSIRRRSTTGARRRGPAGGLSPQAAAREGAFPGGGGEGRLGGIGAPPKNENRVAPGVRNLGCRAQERGHARDGGAMGG